MDCWSLGIITHELITGQPPFESDREADIFLKIKTQHPDLLKLEQLSSVQARDFVAGLLKQEAQQRMTIEEVLSHPFISQIEDRPLLFGDLFDEASSHRRSVAENDDGDKQNFRDSIRGKIKQKDVSVLIDIADHLKNDLMWEECSRLVLCAVWIDLHLENSMQMTIKLQDLINELINNDMQISLDPTTADIAEAVEDLVAIAILFSQDALNREVEECGRIQTKGCKDRMRRSASFAISCLDIAQRLSRNQEKAELIRQTTHKFKTELFSDMTSFD